MIWLSSTAVGVVSLSLHGLLSYAWPTKVLDDNTVRPGWLGLGVVVALVVACGLLFRSLLHQVNKIDPSLPRSDEPEPVEPPVPPVPGIVSPDGDDGDVGP
jgi:hypothetical protein